MSLRLLLLSVITALGVMPSLCLASPLSEIRKAAGKSDTLPRMPNDNVEGAIWEYKAEYKRRLKEGEEKPKPLEGRFRTEGEAVFDVGRRLQLPKLPKGNNPREIARSVRKSLEEGAPSEIKLPTTEVKRIGEYRLSKDKLIIQFDDEKTLHGTMVLRRKKRTTTVWHGDYAEKEGKKTVRKWSVEVRPIED